LIDHLLARHIGASAYFKGGANVVNFKLVDIGPDQGKAGLVLEIACIGHARDIRGLVCVVAPAGDIE
jgi:hypothetical protein